jgi:hypothetical protein
VNTVERFAESLSDEQALMLSELCEIEYLKFPSKQSFIRYLAPILKDIDEDKYDQGYEAGYDEAENKVAEKYELTKEVIIQKIREELQKRYSFALAEEIIRFSGV